MLAAFLVAASPALAAPPWSQRNGALCLLCPSHLPAKDGSVLESTAVWCTEGPGDNTYLTGHATTLKDSFLTLDRVEKGPWGFANRASETGLTGGRVVNEAGRRPTIGVYSDSVLIGLRWAF